MESADAAATGSTTGAGDVDGDGLVTALGATGGVDSVATGVGGAGVAATEATVAAAVGDGTAVPAGLTEGVELPQPATAIRSAAASAVRMAAVRRLGDMDPSARTTAGASYQRCADAPSREVGRSPFEDSKKRPAEAGRSAMHDRSEGPSDPRRVGGPQAIGSARGTS